MKNEKTPNRVASIAGKILGAMDFVLVIVPHDGRVWNMPKADVRALASSCLAQAPGKKKRRTPKRK